MKSSRESCETDLQFDCDECEQNCDEVNSVEDGNTFLCTNCYLSRPESE